MPTLSPITAAFRAARIPLAACLAAVWLGACAGEEVPAEPEAGTLSIRIGENGLELAGATPDGRFKTQFGGDVAIPAGFPTDVPIYPDARPTAAISAVGRGTMTTFESGDPPEKVYTFYRERLVAAGWRIDTEADLGGQYMLRCAKAGQQASVSITGSDAGARIAVTADPNG
jgi:hypothetical protein